MSFKAPLMELIKVFPAIDPGDRAFGFIVRQYGKVMGEFVKATDEHNTNASFLNPKVKASLVELSMAFVDLASHYDPKDHDCRAVLRRKVVDYLARSTLASAAIVDPQISKKLPNHATLNVNLDAERAQIIGEVPACLNQRTKERL